MIGGTRNDWYRDWFLEAFIEIEQESERNKDIEVLDNSIFV